MPIFEEGTNNEKEAEQAEEVVAEVNEEVANLRSDVDFLTMMTGIEL